MATAGLVQASIGLVAGVLDADLRGGVFTIVLALLWFVAAILFQKATAK
jgi:hypothetical protein